LLAQDVGNAITRQWLTVAIDEDMLPVATHCHGAQPVQRIRRFDPVANVAGSDKVGASQPSRGDW
jgi:hypothetical protein